MSHENKEAQLQTIIASQDAEISTLRSRLDTHTNKIRLFLLKQSSKFQLKPLPKPMDLNEILPNAFQTIDLQGLMQGIYKKTEEIFSQLNSKLQTSNDNVAKLRGCLANYSQTIEGLQAKISFLEQENQSLRVFRETNDDNDDRENEFADLKKRNKELNTEERGSPNEILELRIRMKDLTEELNQKDRKISSLEQELNHLREHSERLEKEMLETKIKISEAMNLAFESGGPELVEFFEKAILGQTS